MTIRDVIIIVLVVAVVVLAGALRTPNASARWASVRPVVHDALLFLIVVFLAIIVLRLGVPDVRGLFPR